MTPGYLEKLVELGGAVGRLESGEVVGRMVAKESNRPTKKNPWQFKVDPETNCWEWQRAITPRGYGNFVIGKDTRAHRAYYRLLKEEIPEGLELDHLCRDRACVNPSHLDPVSSKENTMRGVGLAAENARKTHCVRGHELRGNNLRIAPHRKRTKRVCRICTKTRGEK